MCTRLTYAEILLNNVTNKKNRSASLQRSVKQLEGEVKANTRSFLEKKEVLEYDKFIRSSKSIIKSQDSAVPILVNLIVRKGSLPKISRVVDCMNVVSVRNGLTISIWDKEKVNGDILYKMSEGGEKYWPFMGEEVSLLPSELAAFDDEKCLCLVRYRDSKYAPASVDSKEIIIHIQGVNEIEKNVIEKAAQELSDLIIENTGATLTYKRIVENFFNDSTPNRTYSSNLTTSLLPSPPCSSTILPPIPISNNSHKQQISIRWQYGGKNVLLAGSFNNWKGIPMIYYKNEWILSLLLEEKNSYQFKFIVDGYWYYDIKLPTVKDPMGNINNILQLKENIQTETSQDVYSIHKLHAQGTNDYK